MKVQVAFDLIDLERCLVIARDVEEYADVFEVGTLLLYKYGERAVRTFKDTFPQKIILADAKIADRGKEATQLLVGAGADWVTVMAGVDRAVIHAVTQAAHDAGKRVMLDLLDASSLGQSALEAKSLGVDALIFHVAATEDTLSFMERWDMVRGNTKLPVFIGGAMTRETIHTVIAAAPEGVVLSNCVVFADNPRAETQFFHKHIAAHE